MKKFFNGLVNKFYIKVDEMVLFELSLIFCITILFTLILLNTTSNHAAVQNNFETSGVISSLINQTTNLG